jgi:hypothetical protein
MMPGSVRWSVSAKQINQISTTLHQSRISLYTRLLTWFRLDGALLAADIFRLHTAIC